MVEERVEVAYDIGYGYGNPCRYLQEVFRSFLRCLGLEKQEGNHGGGDGGDDDSGGGEGGGGGGGDEVDDPPTSSPPDDPSIMDPTDEPISATTIPVKWVENHYHGEEPPVNVLLKSHDGSLWKHHNPVFDKEPLKVNVPKQWVTLEVKDGHKFRVKVVKEENYYKISNGWIDVWRDIPLHLGDFIAFFLIDPYTFHMIPFLPNEIELICPKKEMQDSEYIAIEEEKEVNFDDNNAEADEVRKTFTKTNTSRFQHLPIHVAKMAGLDQNNEMRFVDLTGQETTVSVRSEKSGNYKRYTTGAAFWKNFMKKNTIALGDSCTFDYNILDHKLSIVRVDMV
ncbi:hypothetical protein E3N88_26402 [Mikania micrantha]|uniref:TF-B3 domain-containing protein n=1 Tax=Mikania micrantha TaxID=192012 RepID=A0A5N6N978_9ASTR|nr:hypothetical protein E3N88_26402 [Mikania micrantha]